MPPVIDSPSKDGRLPEPGTAGVRVSSYPTLLFIQVCSPCRDIDSYSLSSSGPLWV
jgi:hypothetical protein